mgnify:CR=1 FL=1
MAPSSAVIGVFGGSFDPIHLGHLLVAEQAREQLGLSRLLFMPAARSPHKGGQAPADDHHRRAMVELAIADHPAFALSLVDLDRPPPSYTVDSLALLHAARPRVEWVLVLGADSLVGLSGWKEPARIVAQARLAVFARPGATPYFNTGACLFPGQITGIEIVRGRIQWLASRRSSEKKRRS